MLYNFIFYNRRRWMTIQALLLSAWVRLLLWRIPFARLHPFLGEAGRESTWAQPTREAMREITWISDRVSRVAKRTPWQSKCFVQALVAQALLKGHRLPSTLYLGVGKDAQQQMIAHAWLRCGPCYVTGGNGTGYAIVARFTRRPRRSMLPEDGEGSEPPAGERRTEDGEASRVSAPPPAGES